MEFDDGPKIDHWKVISEEMTKRIRQKQEEEKKARRAKELEELQTLRNYVHERIITMERYHTQRQHIAEEYEKNRLFEREMAKEARRKLRFEQYLQYERGCMAEEDYRSYLYREYYHEQQREWSEREAMFNEELEQTEIDRFWGFDSFHHRFRREEDRLHDVYIQQLREKNHQLYLMQCTKKIPKQYFSSYLPKITKASSLVKAEITQLPPPLILPEIASPGMTSEAKKKQSYTLISNSLPSRQQVSFSQSKGLSQELVNETIKEDVDLPRPLSKQELYEYQARLNDYEKQKQIQYIKQLKAEELRKEAKAKLRPPIYSIW